jgi:hypothetical protein
MKIHKLILFFLVFCFSGCVETIETDSQQVNFKEEFKTENKFKLELFNTDTTYAIRIMPQGDPNLNPNWQWYSSESQSIYYKNSTSIVQVPGLPTTPFFTNGHILADATSNDKKDMWPEDGWMLVARDFGTSLDAIRYPFFILYNKYTGILRVCIFNAPQDNYTDYLVKLSYTNSSDRKAIFTSDSDFKSYLNNFDTNISKSVMAKVSVNQGWVHADFHMFGYDASISSNTELKIELFGSNFSNLTMSSTAFSLEGKIGSTSPTNNGLSLLDAVNYTDGIYKGVNGIVDALNKVKQGKNASTQNNLTNLQNSLTLPSWTSFIGPTLSLIKTILGGKNSVATSPTPIRLTGNLAFSGSISSQVLLQQLTFSLKQDNSKPEVYKPIQNIPWGVFNLNSLPIFINSSYSECYYDPSNSIDECIEEGYWEIVFNRDVNYIINPSLGLINPTIEYFIPGLHSNGQFVSSSTNYINNYYKTNTNPQGDFYGPPPPRSNKIGIKVTYGLPTRKNYDTELIFIKEYDYRLSSDL